MPDDSRLPSTHVTLRLPAELVERFDKLAAAMDRSRSWVMLRALRQYLEAEGRELEDDMESIAQLDRGGASREAARRAALAAGAMRRPDPLRQARRRRARGIGGT